MSEKTLVQFKLMLPSDLKQRVEEAASSSRRSLSQEIVATLEKAYPSIPFDHVSLEALLDRVQNASGPEEKSAILAAFQAFLRATGSTAQVMVDREGDITLRA